jgi:hypothetical protein
MRSGIGNSRLRFRSVQSRDFEIENPWYLSDLFSKELGDFLVFSVI